MGICKVCGKKAESDYCFRHKPRKALKAIRSSRIESKSKKEEDIGLMREFFTRLWNKRKHECENCGKWLGREPLSYMFDHTLEKSKYQSLKYEEDNIMFLCLECHENKTNGILSEKITERIKKLKEKYNIFG